MKNCLVTKLKGAFTFNVVSGGTSTYVRFGADQSDVVLKIIGDSHWTDSGGTADYGKELTIAAGSEVGYIRYTDFTGVIEVHNKYNVTGYITADATHLFSTKGLDCTKFKSANSSNGAMSGYVSELPVSLTSFTFIQNDAFKGDFNDFARLINLETLQVNANATAPIIPGNISVLGSLVSLTKLRFPGITGSIEGFVAAQRGNGRTSVASSSPVKLVDMNKTTVTFNGATITASGEKNLYWDATSITFDGTTISNSAIVS